MADVIAGVVVDVAFTPGRADGQVRLLIVEVADTTARLALLAASAQAAHVTINGKPVDLSSLLAWLALGACRVALGPPDPTVGGASLKADFTALATTVPSLDPARPVT